MAKIEPFERYTEQYEDWFLKNRFVYESELEAIRGQLPEGKRGIEIGVGSGRFAAPLGIDTGIEPSHRMWEIARKRGIRVINAVAENLPLRDSSHDFILMVTTICFLDDIIKSFKEVYRVLQKKGLFIIGFVDKYSPLGRVYQAHKEKSLFYRPATFYSVNEVLSYLRQTGFKEFVFRQTIFRDISEIREIEETIEGYGRGSFVVIRASK